MLDMMNVEALEYVFPCCSTHDYHICFHLPKPVCFFYSWFDQTMTICSAQVNPRNHLFEWPDCPKSK